MLSHFFSKLSYGFSDPNLIILDYYEARYNLQPGLLPRGKKNEEVVPCNTFNKHDKGVCSLDITMTCDVHRSLHANRYLNQSSVH